MHARNRTWPLGSDPAERCRQRTLPVEGGDGSTLSLDFTTGVLDPRLTFTRGTNATFINSSGLVQYAASNQQIYSQDQSQSGTWVRVDLNGVDANVGATTDPQGGNTASKLRSAATLQAHLIYSTISTSISSGLAYTFSVYVKKAELKYVALHLASTARYTVVFDLDTGLMTTTNSTGTPLGTAYSSQDAGNGWWRLSATMITQTTTIYPHICLSNSATPAVNASGQPYYTGVLNDGVYTWGAQLNAGSTPLQYIATTTAQKFDQPRFDYDPTTLAPRGLLIEGQATNVITGVSAGSGLSLTANAISSPSGVVDANLFTKTNTTTPRYVVWSYSLTPAANTTYTASMFVKRGNVDMTTSLEFNDSANWGAVAWTVNFNVTSTGVTVGTTAGGGTGRVEPYRDGWYRVMATFTTGAAPTAGGNILSKVSGTTNDTIYIWGGQLETGSGASSYIPTGASQGTRNADSCDCTSGNFSSWYTQGPGTLLVHARPFRQNYSDLASLCTSTSDPRFAIRTNDPPSAAGITLYGNNVGTIVSIKTSNSYSINNLLKTAVGLQQGNYAVVLNGGTVNADPGTGTFPTALNRLTIGHTASGGEANAWISLIKYWPTRLPDAQLQSLTTI